MTPCSFFTPNKYYMRHFINIVENQEKHIADDLDIIYPKVAASNSNFMKWFNGSKVVDKTGLPLLVYRGRSHRWTVMPTGAAEELKRQLEQSGSLGYFKAEMDFAERLGDVAWFTNDEGTAYGYLDGASGGDVLPAYLCLKNPLILSVEMLGEEEAERRISEVLESPISLKQQYGSPAKAMADTIVYDNSVIVQYARQNGYDGIIHDDTTINGRHTHTSYVAFYPHQIKSAQNTGEFRPSELNIHK